MKTFADGLEKKVGICTLCAFYGGLLTQKQRDALRMHYEEDCSLGEIADVLGVSRQNIHDLLTRSEQKLIHYESVLGIAARASESAKALREADSLLAGTPKEDSLRRVHEILQNEITRQEGE